MCTVAPGIMETPLLGRLREPARKSPEDSVPNSKRLDDPAGFGALARHIAENPYFNGETIRLEGAHPPGVRHPHGPRSSRRSIPRSSGPRGELGFSHS